MVPKDPRIVIAMWPSPEVRTYSVNTVVSKAHIETFYAPYRQSSQEYLDKLGRIGSSVARKLLDTPGVEAVTVQAYELQIKIGRAFNWSEIEPSILNIAKKAFGRSGSKWVSVEGPWWCGIPPSPRPSVYSGTSGKDEKEEIQGTELGNQEEVEERPDMTGTEPQGEASSIST